MRQFSTRTVVSLNRSVNVKINFAAFHSVQVLLGRKKQSDETVSKTAMPIKVLNVAEKNDAAKNIAQLLSRGSSRRVLPGS